MSATQSAQSEWTEIQRSCNGDIEPFLRAVKRLNKAVDESNLRRCRRERVRRFFSRLLPWNWF